MKFVVLLAALVVGYIQNAISVRECPSGFTKHQSHCYKFDDQRLKSKDANVQCQMQNGYLFRPDKHGELDFIKTQRLDDQVWWRIGGYRRGPDTWFAGNVKDQNKHNNVTGTGPTQLMRETKSGFKFKGNSYLSIGNPVRRVREHSFPYICETETTCEKPMVNSDPPVLSYVGPIYHAHPRNKCKYLHESRCPDGTKWSQSEKTCVELTGGETCPTDYCPTGFVYLGRKCYKFDLQLSQGQAAISRCKEENSHLLVLENRAEDDLISGYLRQHHPDTPAWRIGGYMKSGKWYWNNSSQILCYSNWETKQVPIGTTLLMVNTNSGYKWRGQGETNQPVICEAGAAA